MFGSTAAVVAWLLLPVAVAVSKATEPRAERAPARWGRTADAGCQAPLRRVEMFDVDVGSSTDGYRLREIHVRHAVKVRARTVPRAV